MVYIELLKRFEIFALTYYYIHINLFQPATATEEQKNMYKAMSSGELGKGDARKNSHGDGRYLFSNKLLVVD